MNDALMSCPCGRGDYDMCDNCPYAWCSVHGDRYEDVRYTVYVYNDDDYDPEWGPENYAPDDEDYAAEQYRRHVPVFDCHYDYATRTWVCDCARYVMYGSCLHSYRYRGETVVKVSEEYL